MKKIVFTLLCLMVANQSCIKEENPLLVEKWNTPFETPPFSKIKTEHFKEAVPILINEAKAQVDSVISCPEQPTFENTIVALERCGVRLSRALGVLYNITETNASDELQEVVENLSPMLSSYSNYVLLNDSLFARVKAVHDDSMLCASLDSEDRMLLRQTYKGFVRNGALLSAEDKATAKDLDEKLSLLTLKFAENSRKSTNAFSITVTDSADVAGIPQWGLDMAKEEAAQSGEDGWKFTLQAPSYISVMEHADNRSLRETIWRKYNSIACEGDEFDNARNIRDIVTLRHRYANLLGYQTYADYVISDHMAGTVDRVNSFLDQLLEASYNQAQGEVSKIASYASSKGFWEELQPWDFSYWSEKYREANYALDDNMTRPYFKLDNVEKALFMLAGKLYGLQFRENSEIETPDKDARAYEVLDADGNLQSVLYLDYFPRPSKRSGAWMNTYREACIDASGNEVRPIVTLVCNFTKPTENQPSLLSFDEFQTVLHEFGHGLHGMLAKGRYSSLTGTNVDHDFVELPSQIMENWAYKKEFLDLWAVHYQTGETIPQELIDKILAAKNFNSAYMNVRQLMFGLLDMAWHTASAAPEDIIAFEENAVRSTQLLPVIPATGRSASFTHIFAGGYAAGYYGYKWAEMLEADAFNVFETNGIFDPETDARFKKLLEAGGTRDAMELYVEFTGHEPRVEPLLEKLGIGKND